MWNIISLSLTYCVPHPSSRNLQKASHARTRWTSKRFISGVLRKNTLFSISNRKRSFDVAEEMLIWWRKSPCDPHCSLNVSQYKSRLPQSSNCLNLLLKSGELNEAEVLGGDEQEWNRNPAPQAQSPALIKRLVLLVTHLLHLCWWTSIRAVVLTGHERTYKISLQPRPPPESSLV